MSDSKKCPCGSGRNYDKCCARYLEGKANPTNPEMLMRSRYTAYTKADIAYISKTMSGKAIASFDEEASTKWATTSEWLGLTILKADPVAVDETVGYVDFLVKYKTDGQIFSHHEISEFHKVEDIWYYVDGIVNPKFGRNDPCFCGSGKKHKKCCC